jgi:hypothetical protein
MFMQAWGHYGTAWPVVHQQLGVRPNLGAGRLDIAPAVPSGAPRVAGRGIRLGNATASIRASVAGSTYTTRTDTRRLRGVTAFRIGAVLPAGSTVGSVTLDGTPVASPQVQQAAQGVRVLVSASARKRHKLVVTAA